MNIKPIGINHKLDDYATSLIERSIKFYGGNFVVQMEYSGYPAFIFYKPNPDTEKGHTHYYGICNVYGNRIIFNAEPLVKGLTITGLLIVETGEIIYSSSRHDFVTADTDPECWIDGGRDYTRCSYNEGCRAVSLTVENGELVVSE